MSEQVQSVTELPPVKTNVLRKFAKRTIVVATAAAVVVGAIYLKTRSSDTEENSETTEPTAA